MKIQLIANWNNSWKWLSMQTAAAVTVLNTFALSFPPSWSQDVHIVTIVLGVITMYGRIIQQTPMEPKQ